MTDEMIERLVRTVVPESDNHGPDRDLWPLVAARLDGRPRWAWLDFALAAALLTMLLLFPECFALLVYHL